MDLISYICYMKFLKRLFKKSNHHIYKFTILEMDDEDAIITFNDGTFDYILELEWEKGVMDIEFGIKDAEFHDTTNHNNHYNVMRTIAYITRRIADGITRKNKRVFHTVTFKSSNWRDGDIDFKSGEIRNRFFARYVIHQFPNAEVVQNEHNLITIKLNRV